MHLVERSITNFLQFGAGAHSLSVKFKSGITALVGCNDSGKSANVDAIRYALSTRDQEFNRVQLEDFFVDRSGTQASEISIFCTPANLSEGEKRVNISSLPAIPALRRVLMDATHGQSPPRRGCVLSRCQETW